MLKYQEDYDEDAEVFFQRYELLYDFMKTKNKQKKFE